MLLARTSSLLSALPWIARPELSLLYSEATASYWQKPPYSYIALITMAISSRPDRKMTLSQVQTTIQILDPSMLLTFQF